MPRAVILTLAAAAWLAPPAPAADPPQPPTAPEFSLADVARLTRLVPSADRVMDLVRSAKLSIRLPLPDAPWVRYLGFSDRATAELALVFDEQPTAPKKAKPAPPRPVREQVTLPDGTVFNRLVVTYNAQPPLPATWEPLGEKVQSRQVQVYPAPQARFADTPAKPSSPYTLEPTEFEKLDERFRQLADAQPGALIGAGVGSPVVPPKAGLIGTWYRDLGPMQVVLKVAADHLTATWTISAKSAEGTVTQGIVVTADYTVSRDGGSLHGIITGVDMVLEGKFTADGSFGPDAMMEPLKKLQALADQPFAVGFRVMDGELAIRRVRVAGLGDDEKDGPFEMMAGRYKSAGGKPVPKPKPMKVDGAEVVQAPRLVNTYSDVPPQLVQGPIPVGPPVMVSPAPLPYAASAPAPVQPPVIQAAGSAVVLPNPPIAAPAPSAPESANKLAGTWVREMPGVRVMMKLTDRRLRADVTMAFEEGKTVIRWTTHLDADYAVSPEGMVFGVITGVDVSFPDDLPADKLKELPAALAQMSQLSGEPFRFRARAEDGVLSVRDLKLTLPGEKLDAETLAAVQGYFGGRYKPAGNKSLPPVKPGRSSHAQVEAVGGMTLPSPHYLEHYPQYIPPDPPFPLQRELAAMETVPMPRPAVEEAPMPRASKPSRFPQPKGLPPVMPPLKSGEKPPVEPPTDQEIMRAIPKRLRGTPYVYEEFWDDIVIVKNKVKDEFESPRFYPEIGIAQRHRCQWECDVYYTETVQTENPIPATVRKAKVQTVVIDTDKLYLVNDPGR